jgi:hypothetical protein
MDKSEIERHLENENLNEIERKLYEKAKELGIKRMI